MSEHERLTARDWSSHPPFVAPAYKSSVPRGPSQPLVTIPHGEGELTAPWFAVDDDSDLCRNGMANGAPLGERIVVAGRVLDECDRPLARVLVELWQANAAGRYIHGNDRHDAPIDPNFFGKGHCLTDADGRYRFLTIRPGAYPWGNSPNAWRPPHIHFSLLGPCFASRLVTQMYFPGDPLLPHDPIFTTVPEAARDRLVARLSFDVTEADWALGYQFDMVLRGAHATPTED